MIKPNILQINEEIQYQKNLLKKFKRLKKSYLLNYLGKEIAVFPKVFEPNLDTEVLIKSLKFFQFSSFLEVGGGTGVVSLFACDRATEGVVVDINDCTLINICENVKNHGLGNRLRVLKSNLFEQCPTKKYDLIIANLPFMNMNAKDVVEKAIFDKNLGTWNIFLKNVSTKLNNGGSILTVLPNFCAYQEIMKLARKNNFRRKRLLTIKSEWMEFTSYKFYK